MGREKRVKTHREIVRLALPLPLSIVKSVLASVGGDEASVRVYNGALVVEEPVAAIVNVPFPGIGG